MIIECLREYFHFQYVMCWYSTSWFPPDDDSSRHHYFATLSKLDNEYGSRRYARTVRPRRRWYIHVRSTHVGSGQDSTKTLLLIQWSGKNSSLRPLGNDAERRLHHIYSRVDGNASCLLPILDYSVGLVWRSGVDSGDLILLLEWQLPFPPLWRLQLKDLLLVIVPMD